MLTRPSQAITEMTRQIRSGKIRNGLVLANGGVLSYQHAICLSSNRRTDGAEYTDSRKDSDAVVGGLSPLVETFAEGEAIVEVSVRPKGTGCDGSADVPRRRIR